ncbi:unnamed protein product, partial [Brassica oleracea var. botrytis]
VLKGLDLFSQQGCISGALDPFSQQGSRVFCILSANGIVANVTLRQHGTHKICSIEVMLISELRFSCFSNDGSHHCHHIPNYPPKGVQRPNRRDVKSIVAKARTRMGGNTAVPPLPPSYERLVTTFDLTDIECMFY